MKQLWILSCLVVFSISAFAEGIRLDDCEVAVDLRERGYSMRGVQTLHQGDSYLCAQHTTVGLLQAFLKTQNPTKQFLASPTALAIEFAADNRFPRWFPVQNTTDPLSVTSLRTGGTVCPLIKHAREYEACNDPLIGDQNAKDSPLTIDTYLKLYSAIVKREPHLAERLHLLMLEGFKSKVAPSIAAIESVLEKSRDPYVILRELTLQGCESRRTQGLSALPSCSISLVPANDLREAEEITRIATLLDSYGKNALPVPFAFCYEIFDEGLNYKSRNLWNCGAHWSLIIGKKNIDGQCHFLVRNSYGKNETYSKDWTVDKGDIWIRADTLIRATSVVEWITPHKPAAEEPSSISAE